MPTLFERLFRFMRTPKGTLAAIFVPLAITASLAVGLQVAIPHLLAAVLGASLIEVLVARLDGRPLAWPSSAVLSGLIVAFVLDPSTLWFITACVGVLATLSKHLLATQRWHVFNPAALALLISIPLFGTGQSWWGALTGQPWPLLVVLVAAGAVLIDRINKFPLVLAFLGSYFGALSAIAAINPLPVAEMFRDPFMQSALFFALFMLTDPPTSPARQSDQVWIGVLTGIVSVAAQLLGVGQAYLLVGLLVGNVALACRRFANERRARSVRMAPARPAFETP